jgi:hypothetical protein
VKSVDACKLGQYHGNCEILGHVYGFGGLLQHIEVKVVDSFSMNRGNCDTQYEEWQCQEDHKSVDEEVEQ